MITHVAKHGDLTVRHVRSHLTVGLPSDYVRASTGLGYAPIGPRVAPHMLGKCRPAT
jgi:hypothetical protein